jgi:hypothetical protein
LENSDQLAHGISGVVHRFHALILGALALRRNLKERGIAQDTLMIIFEGTKTVKGEGKKNMAALKR